jgi:L-ascorbate metabolism protein UlaG (beta-lactamase superfamily)
VGGARIAYLGHATLLIELDGVRILTDPVLGGRLGPLRRHGPTPDPGAVGDLDAFLISHAHPDHFDPASLRQLAAPARVVVPLGLGAAAAGLAGHVTELAVGGSVEVGSVRVTAVPALHWRWPLRPRAHVIGYLIEGSTGLYFAGDTRFFPSMAALAGRVDVALLPVGRWGPHPGPDRLGPASAAEAARVVGASIAIPIHWGTFYPAGFWRVWPRPLREPAARFAAELAAIAPEIDVRLLEPGAETRIAPRSPRRR